MKVAVEGCCHGQLDSIYSHIAKLEAQHKYKVDLLLICGDFQAIRNHRDLQCMAVPPKYRQLGEFHNYYTGAKKAPILTIVIGGNHEASNYLWELYHGGWLAPNIYFIGHAGSVLVNGVRIAGASGIFKSNDFHKGSFEKMPYDSSSMRSIYHIREYCVRRLSLLPSPDIFLSHDWPQSIEHFGDVEGLLRRKKHFRSDVDSGRLGSPPLMGLMNALKPRWWFAAHLHVRFEAQVVHGEGGPEVGAVAGVGDGEVRGEVAAGENPDEIVIDEDEDTIEGNASAPSAESGNAANGNPDEIVLDEEAADVASPPRPASPPRTTSFLALDKCLPQRQFLEVVDIPTPIPTPTASSSPVLTYDPHWLAIVRAFHPLLSTEHAQSRFPDEANARAMVAQELAWVRANIPGARATDEGAAEGAGMCVEECQVFAKTAPGPGDEDGPRNKQPPWYTNPQTVAFCKMLELENKINAPPQGFAALTKETS